MRTATRTCVIAAVWILAFSGVAVAQDDRILAGYRLFADGDQRGAQEHFAKLVAERPKDLAARYGLLVTIESRSRRDRPLEGTLERDLDAFLDAAGERYRRSERDAEALFYLAQGHLLRGRYRMSRDKGMFGAARDGVKAKRYTDAYLARHPEHGDAYLALGVYNFYVDIAPAFVRVLRILLFMPGGNRAEGVRQLERAATEGRLFTYPARMLLMEIYSQFEGRTADAIRLAEALRREHPDNPEVLFETAELYASPLVEDYRRAADQYAAALALKGTGDPTVPLRARYRLALTQFHQWQTAEAIATLTSVIDAPGDKPAWVLPQFLLQRANYRSLTNDPRAGEDARRVLALKTTAEWHKRATEHLRRIETSRSSGEDRVYAALIPGNRLMAERRWEDARRAYDALRAQYGTDAQFLYRTAYLDFARGDHERAAGAFARLADDARAPQWVRANALLHLGRAHDLAGRREAATKAYQRILDDFEREGPVWPARVGLITPYRRPGRT